MRKLARYLSILIAFVLLIGTAHSAFLFTSYQVAVNSAGTIDEDAEPVCYINNPSNRYVSFVKAFKAANSGDVVVAIPPEVDAVYPSGAVTDANFNAYRDRVASEIDICDYTMDYEADMTYGNCAIIPEGVTFVLPYDTSSVSSVTSASAAETYATNMKTGCHKRFGTSTITYPDEKTTNFLTRLATSTTTIFRRMRFSIPANVKLINRGTIIVSGILSGGQGASGYNGHTSHSYAEILMGNNAQIVQENASSKLYCFGYISEASANRGSVVDIKNGSVYLPFVLRDYRGAQASYACANDGMNSTYYLSPFNRFEFRNIASKLIVRNPSILYGMANIKDTNPADSSSIDEVQQVNLIGTTTDYFISLPSGARMEGKYTTSTTVSALDFYGGFTLSKLVLSVKVEVTSLLNKTVTMDTNNCLFPLSYHFQIGLYGSGAVYNFGNQRVKVMPGSSLTVGAGATLNCVDLIAYTAFADRIRPSQLNTGSLVGTGIAYPGGRLAGTIYLHGTINASGVLTGNMILCGSSYSYTAGSTVSTCYEYLTWITENSLYVLQGMIILRERLLAYTESQIEGLYAVHVGVQCYSQLPDYTPEFNFIVNESETAASAARLDPILGYRPATPIRRAGEAQTTAGTYNSSDGYQTTYYLPSGTQYSYHLLGDIYLIYENGTANSNIYTMGSKSVVTAARSASVISSGTAITESQFAISGFVSGSHSFPIPGREGTYVTYVGSTLTLYGEIENSDTAYVKRMTWTSSNTKIATATASSTTTTCTVRGIAAGTCTVTVYADDDHQATFEIIVYASADDLIGGDSGFVAINQSSCSLSSDAGNRINGHTSESKQSSSTMTLSYNSGAWINSISWAMSGGGNISYWFESSGTKTASGSTSQVCIFKGDAGVNADEITITCTITDYAGNTATVTYTITIAQTAACLIEGTLITMADGSKKPIEEVKKGEMVWVLDHEDGQWKGSPVIISVSHEARPILVIRLKFSDGTFVDISDSHGFLNLEKKEYVEINEHNARSFVGDRFLREDGEGVKLVDAEFREETTRAFNLTVANTYSCVSNGILGVGSGVQGWVNIFELDDDLKFDPEKKQADIDRYGLFTPEDFEGVLPPEIFDIFPLAYMKVSLGKGLISQEKFDADIEGFKYYSDHPIA